jgi:hypothetical protein
MRARPPLCGGRASFLLICVLVMKVAPTKAFRRCERRNKMIAQGSTNARATDPGTTIAWLAEWIAVGGWPGLLNLSTPQALRAVRAYVDESRRADVQRVDGVAHDPEKVLLLMRSLARNVSTMTSLATLARDLGGPNQELAKNTVGSYHDALSRLMVVEDQPAWDVGSGHGDRTCLHPRGRNRSDPHWSTWPMITRTPVRWGLGPTSWHGVRDSGIREEGPRQVFRIADGTFTQEAPNGIAGGLNLEPPRVHRTLLT